MRSRETHRGSAVDHQLLKFVDHLARTISLFVNWTRSQATRPSIVLIFPIRNSESRQSESETVTRKTFKSRVRGPFLFLVTFGKRFISFESMGERLEIIVVISRYQRVVDAVRRCLYTHRASAIMDCEFCGILPGCASTCNHARSARQPIPHNAPNIHFMPTKDHPPPWQSRLPRSVHLATARAGKRPCHLEPACIADDATLIDGLADPLPSDEDGSGADCKRASAAKYTRGIATHVQVIFRLDEPGTNWYSASRSHSTIFQRPLSDSWSGAKRSGGSGVDGEAGTTESSSAALATIARQSTSASNSLLTGEDVLLSSFRYLAGINARISS